MSTIYHKHNTKLTKLSKGRYKLDVEWDGLQKKFWVNFPFSLIKVIKREDAGANKERRVFTIQADHVATLEELLKHNRDFNYSECLSLLYDVGNQLQSLERFNLGIAFLRPNDIVAIGSHFMFMNGHILLPISNKEMTIEEPYKRTPFFSPEMQNLTGIPSQISFKSGYYSLASLVVFCLTGRHIATAEESSGEILDKLYATKLYWALERCLETNPRDRFYLII